MAEKKKTKGKYFQLVAKPSDFPPDCVRTTRSGKIRPELEQFVDKDNSKVEDKNNFKKEFENKYISNHNDFKSYTYTT